MLIHTIQTGSVMIRPSQLRGKGRYLPLRLGNAFFADRRWTEPLPIHAWAIEHPEGILVIETGETARAAQPGYFPAWHPHYRNVRFQVTPKQEIGPQLQAKGIDPDDVRWVIPTHLHTDHAGGLRHFRKAEILVLRQEYERARGLAGQVRGNLPHRWPEWFAPRVIDLAPEPFGPFPSSFKVTRAVDVVLVPTFGHTAGHLAVILLDSDVACFFAGDASYTQQQMLDQQIDGVSLDTRQVRTTFERMHQFVRATPTVYLPTHDPRSGERLVNRNIVRL